MIDKAYPVVRVGEGKTHAVFDLSQMAVGDNNTFCGLDLRYHNYKRQRFGTVVECERCRRSLALSGSARAVTTLGGTSRAEGAA